MQVDKTEDRGEYIYIQVSGTFDFYQATQKFLEFFAVIREKQISKILMDCRNLTGRYSMSERFKLNTFIAEEHMILLRDGKSEPIKLATVLHESLLDPDRFGQWVAKIRGLNNIATDNIAEAYEWLGVQQPDEIES